MKVKAKVDIFWHNIHMHQLEQPWRMKNNAIAVVHHELMVNS